MNYRSIGKTGIQASVIGLGAEHLDQKPYAVVEETIHAALDHGVNIMDAFMPGEEIRRHVGRALGSRRDKMLIQGHLCSTDINQQYDISRDIKVVKKYFEDLLRFLGTDYIDFGMLFFIDSEADFNGAFTGPVLEYARELKEKGIVRHLGASSHDPVWAARAVETGLIDVLMFSINPAFDMVPPATDIASMIGDSGKPALAGQDGMNPERARLYRLCESRGVGITVMKTLAAGKLLSSEMSPFAKPLTVGQCIHYALTRPAVASVLIGCQSRRHVEEATAYLTAPEAELDYAPVVGSMKADFKGACVYCSHCLPCPADIDIAGVTRQLDVATLDAGNIPEAVRKSYAALGCRASDCVACGSCEERCPFGVPVMENMRRAAALFGL